MTTPPKYNLSEPIGLVLPLSPIGWNTRDLLLYAVSIGNPNTALDVIYEGAKGFSAYPTYPVVFPFKGNATDIINFAEKFGNVPPIPGLPVFPPTTLVQGSQYLEVLKPLPLEGTSGWQLGQRIVGVHENSTGVSVDYEQTILDPNNDIYARLITVGTYLGGVANGVPFDKTISTGIQRSIADPGSHHPPLPQWTVTEPTIKTQSDFYRLNGDYNPLHIDPAIGKELGYGGLIMHGLLVYAIAVRAILTNFANDDTTALKSVFANFSGPVTPGDSVVVKVWKLGPGPAGTGTTELAFEAHARSTGTLALGQGVALVVISEDPSVIPQPGQDVDAGVGTVTQAMNPVVASGAWLVSFFSSPIHKLLAWFAR